MTRKIIIALLVVFVAVGAYFYIDAIVRNKIKDSVAKRLQDKIGPAQSYKVEITGGLIDFIRGNLAELDVKGNKVELRTGVTLDTLQISMQGIKFNTRKAAISSIDKTTFEGLLSQDELNKYVSQAHPDMSELNIILQDGYFTMTARPLMIRSNTLVNAQGNLAIIDGSKVVLQFSRVETTEKSASKSWCEYFESTVNPVFNTEDISFHPKLTSVTIIPGTIKLVGHFDSLDTRAF